ncbi:hypothetical protein JHK82_034492 [Glycine max]|nr:hypothetical protein JHK85_035205 [Glycine max]KAG4986872.1 hypothetical protein JHK86_034563 [Glycine max]KAG5120072.1 hypothetical protein JHK82_034492 [Glycine max]KAG5141059.1 hypothetical protein JHK84_034827 [Glycine max]
MAEGVVVSLQEWQGWGTTSPLPTMVAQIVEDLKVLEEDLDAHMSFGGNGGKLQGNFRVQEDKKHRATYQALGDSEKKLQFYSARQIACRILVLASHGGLYVFKSHILFTLPWNQDFLRQNNTGKILWQVFGVNAATLCLFGIPEHEEIMWNSFKMAALKSVENAFGQEPVASDEVAPSEDKAKSVWGDEDLACISLNPGASAMHKLRCGRPQPSWDRTCTAAAAAGLLSELQLLPQFSTVGLDEQEEAVEHALTVLLDALTNRRLRVGSVKPLAFFMIKLISVTCLSLLKLVEFTLRTRTTQTSQAGARDHNNIIQPRFAVRLSSNLLALVPLGLMT